MTLSLRNSPPALVESIHAHAVREINALEQRIADAEDAADQQGVTEPVLRLPVGKHLAVPDFGVSLVAPARPALRRCGCGVRVKR